MGEGIPGGLRSQAWGGDREGSAWLGEGVVSRKFWQEKEDLEKQGPVRWRRASHTILRNLCHPTGNRKLWEVLKERSNAVL